MDGYKGGVRQPGTVDVMTAVAGTSMAVAAGAGAGAAAAAAEADADADDATGTDAAGDTAQKGKHGASSSPKPPKGKRVKK